VIIFFIFNFFENNYKEISLGSWRSGGKEALLQGNHNTEISGKIQWRPFPIGGPLEQSLYL